MKKSKQDISNTSESELKRLEWLLTKPGEQKMDTTPFLPSYGDLVPLNTERTIIDAVGEEMLKDISGDYLDLLDTSAAIYEKNGDYALGIFSSGWCRFLDQAARDLCHTNDNREALNSGKWLCHESCWTEASRKSIETGEETDIECNGGLRLFAIPVRAGSEIVGSINFGYGDPPRDPEKLREIAKKYQVDMDELTRLANAYESRPPFIIEIAKKRLHSSARLVGEIIARKRSQLSLLHANEVLESRVVERTLELQKSKQLLDQGAKLAKIGGWELDLITGTLSWSEMTYLIYEVEAGYIPTVESAINFYAPEAVPVISKAVQDAIGQGISFDVELPLITAKGNNIWVRAIGEAYLDKEKIVKIGGIFQDISVRKNAEDELRKQKEILEELVEERTAELNVVVKGLETSNRELEQFAYIVSHDLQEPVRMISSYTKLLEKRYKDKLDEDADDFIRFVVDGTNRMQRMINDLLDFSRVNTKGNEYKRLDLSEILAQAIANLQQKIMETQAFISNEELPFAIGDESQLIRLFQNLIDNAIKFSGDSAPRIAIFAKTEEKTVTISVKDSGIGIDEVYSARIFTIFQRLHSKEQYPGTGIGLAICKRIVERHGGKIWFTSDEGKGTTFWFTLKQ